MSRAKRLPRSFRRGHDDSLACKHRDLTCCPECAAAYPEIVDVVGRHYWVPDATERAELVSLVTGMQKELRESSARVQKVRSHGSS